MKELELIGETKRVAAGPVMDLGSAREQRKDDFWRPIMRKFFATFHEDMNAAHEMERQDSAKKLVLEAIAIATDNLKGGVCGLPLERYSQTLLLEVIMYVIAFDVSFEYLSEDCDDDCGTTETDTIFDESVFQCNVRQAFDEYILEGAALARKAGSASYEKWTRAMIAITNIENGRLSPEEVAATARQIVNGTIEAQEQLWADIRVNVKLNAKLDLKEKKKIVMHIKDKTAKKRKI